MEDDAAPAAAPAPPSSSSALDLGTCTSSELSSYLLARRFDDDAVRTAAFFLECAASLPDAGAISDAFLGGPGGDGQAEQNGDAPATGAVPVISPTPVGPGARTPSEDDVEELLERIGDPLRLSSRPGSPELSPVEISSVSPRGKFILKLHERGFTLTNPKKPLEKSERIVVTCDSLSEDRLALVFPRPEKCSSKLKVVTKKGKKQPEELIRLLLVPLETFCEEGEAVTFRGKVLRQVCLPLPVGQSLPDGEVEAGAGDGSKGCSATLEESDWIEAFGTSLSGEGGKQGPSSERRKKTRMVEIDYPQCRDASRKRRGLGFVFRSDGPSTNPRMPFVGCYHGVNQGSLFPLEEGLLYFKPPLFLPRSDLRSIGCGRGSTGGGGSTSRYVDMHITLHGREGGDDDVDLEEEDAHETVEFTNISRDELNPLSNYIDNVLTPAMARDASSTPPDGGGRGGDGDGEDEGPEEEVVETSSSGGDGTRRRSRREASAHAREATRAQILAADAARRRRNPQEEEDAVDDDNDDSEEGEEDYNVEDDMDSDEDEDHVIDEDDDDIDEDNRFGDNGKGSGEDYDDDDDDDDEDFNDNAMDDDETVSDDSGSDESEDDPPMKKARKD